MLYTKVTIKHPIFSNNLNRGHETKPRKWWGTHEAEASTGGLSVLTSFTLSMTAASNLARVITDVSAESTTAADNGSGRTSIQHNDTSANCQQSYTVTSYIAAHTLIAVPHAQLSGTSNWYQKLALMHMTKIVQFDWSFVFERFWYQKHQTEMCSVRFLVAVSGTSFLSVCHLYNCVPVMLHWKTSKHFMMILKNSSWQCVLYQQIRMYYNQ